jgi:hypothetical protein
MLDSGLKNFKNADDYANAMSAGGELPSPSHAAQIFRSFSLGPSVALRSIGVFCGKEKNDLADLVP